MGFVVRMLCQCCVPLFFAISAPAQENPNGAEAKDIVKEFAGTLQGELKAALAERDTALAGSARELEARSEELRSAREHGDELNHKLGTAHAEIELLQRAAESSKAEFEQLSQRFAELTASNSALLDKVQDLELYIDGRGKAWSEQNAQLAKYRSDLAEAQRSLKSRERDDSRRDKDKDKLNQKILELEKRCSELIGRRRERDDAYQELEEKLADQIKTAEQLRAELKANQSSVDRALEETAEASRTIASLRSDLGERDDSVKALRGSLGDKERALDELNARHEAANSRIAELETALETARGGLAESGREREGLSAALAEAEQKIAELEAKLEAAVEETRETYGKLAVEQAAVRRLESELEERRATLHLLDQNLERINILGASLQKIERGSEGAGATLQHDAPPRNVHYIGGADPGEWARRKMFVSVEHPDRLSFSLSKQDTTIGRSRESDVQINDQFVSRVHARVLSYTSGTIIEDMGSKNGILVNSEPVTRRALKHGDIVSLGGKLDLRYVERDV